MKEISIEEFKEEIESRKIILTIDSYGELINNLLSPVRCKLAFSNVSVNVIAPAYIKLEREDEFIRIAQINKIYRKTSFDNKGRISTLYMIDSGSLECTNKMYTLTCI